MIYKPDANGALKLVEVAKVSAAADIRSALKAQHQAAIDAKLSAHDLSAQFSVVGAEKLSRKLKRKGKR